MKLAEALILRADCQKRIEQLRQRLQRSAIVQEGEQPPEDPQALLSELETTVTQLSDLIKRINKTNCQAILEERITLTDALADRDILLKKRSVYESLINASTMLKNRYSLKEIKSFSTVNVAEMQQRVDRMARDCRELDTKIQAANWNINLLE